MGIIKNNIFKINCFNNQYFVNFTILQLLQRNIQLGALIKFTLLTSYWFIYGIRHNFTIINLSWSILYIRRILILITFIINNKQRVLFVNNFNLIRKINFPKSCGELYILGNWIGGILTNFKKIWLTYQLLLKEKKLKKSKKKLKKSLEGICNMTSLPGIIFLDTILKNNLVSKEAYALKLLIFGLLDTDSISNNILYPIPSNDDTFESINFFNQLIAKSILINKMFFLQKLYNMKKYLYR